MKYINKILLFLLLISCSVQSQVISDYITVLNYNVNIDYINATPFSIYHNQVMVDNIDSVSGTESPSVITNIRGSIVDGFHKDNNGLKYFSFDSDTRLNGVSVLKSDIIRCNDSDCSSFTFILDANLESLKHVNINAFSFDPDNGELVFSIDSDADIEGTNYFASDIIRFTNEGSFVLEYDSIVLGGGFARYKNIDGLSYLPNGFILVSFANESVYHEVFEYYPPTNSWDIAFTPLNLGDSYGNININSLMGFENDLIFKNGFD